ncbi:decaprenyl-diphosphate synthase subunit 2-like [Bradysia coprophila]|uniref:decaprenyl-diphosphate synthase subunit 2-like n=1 Tax=Bradysia coprophila TaxID=38358 RepID=UPI00187D70EF|nr:decaprenyl-diphosphate synthase subunit 2-like [Bradysia coprophila]
MLFSSRFYCLTQRSTMMGVMLRPGKIYKHRRHQLTCTTGLLTVQNNCNTLTTKAIQKDDWHRIVSEAESVVGYPTSFLSLRWLMSDEIANVALYLRKLIESNHPLVKTAKHLLYNNNNHLQPWGLIVLLISKAGGHTIKVSEHTESGGVLHSQRVLAEVTEMIRISFLVHQGVVNLQPLTQAGQDLSTKSDMSFGNKIAILSGDHLLSRSLAELASLRNQDVNELISSAVRDFTESEFIGDRDEQNNPLPSIPLPHHDTHSDDLEMDECVTRDLMKPMRIDNCMGIPEKEWALRHTLSGGSLLARSCQAALKLSGQSETYQKNGYLFGKHLVLAWQAFLELEPFKNDTLNTSFSLVSAPVLFHLDYDPTLYKEIQKGSRSIEDIDYDKVHNAVIKGPGPTATANLQRKHSTAAMDLLNQFPPSDARTALQNIISALQDLRR